MRLPEQTRTVPRALANGPKRNVLPNHGASASQMVTYGTCMCGGTASTADQALWSPHLTEGYCTCSDDGHYACSATTGDNQCPPGGSCAYCKEPPP